MDSSAKYKKFTGSLEDEKQPQGSRKKVVVVLVLVAIVTILVIAIATGVGVGVGVGVSRQFIGLKVIVITREELQGEYYASAGGIHFQTTVNSSFISLFVSTESGKPVVSILHHVNLSMTMVDVKSTNFLVIENQQVHPKYVGYVIPHNLTNLMQSMMVGHKNMSIKVLQQLDNENENQTRRSSMENLAFSQEAHLIIEAAKALGDHGIQGTVYPAAMSFYQLALNLAKTRDAVASNFTLSGKVTKQLRQKRGLICSSTHDMCEKYPFPYDGNDCFGLCGYGCCCWRLVCGSCCVHQYCLTHDQCCADNGFLSWACLSVAWKVWISSCSQTYDC